MPLAILDEPAVAAYGRAGRPLWDAVRTAQGKPGSPLKVLPDRHARAGGTELAWWPTLIEGGSTGSTSVHILQGQADRWSELRELWRVNPLARKFPETAAVLREERDAALRDSRLAAAFKSLPFKHPERR